MIEGVDVAAPKIDLDTPRTLFRKRSGCNCKRPLYYHILSYGADFDPYTSYNASLVYSIYILLQG